jgi:hypothetical protein
VIWQDFYKAHTEWDDAAIERNMPEAWEIRAATQEEVYEVIENIFDDGLRAAFMERVLAAGIRFNIEQTIELMYGVTREIANHLYWACGEKWSADNLAEIEGLVDDAVYAQARQSIFFTNEPIDWDEFVDEAGEWDDDVKLHKASYLTSFGDADEVADVAETFADKNMAAQFMELAIVRWRE